MINPSHILQITRVGELLKSNREVKDSLEFIRGSKIEYVVSETDTQDEYGEPLFILKPLELDEDDYCNFLERLATDDLITQRPTGFKHKLNKSLYKDPYPDVVAWWDIDNHVIFFFGETTLDLVMKMIEEDYEF